MIQEPTTPSDMRTVIPWASAAGRLASARRLAALDEKARAAGADEALRLAAAQHGPAWFRAFTAALSSAVGAFNAAADTVVVRALPLEEVRGLSLRCDANGDHVLTTTATDGVSRPEVFWAVRLHGLDASRHFPYVLDTAGVLALDVDGAAFGPDDAAERLLGRWLAALSLT